ncbi:hypothetical protein GF342_03795 [Candidatus Woesearchaeota archaeon]|nr:hypothetical protein [Candidatus Woesearchaeota archaeon]
MHPIAGPVREDVDYCKAGRLIQEYRKSLSVVSRFPRSLYTEEGRIKIRAGQRCPMGPGDLVEFARTIDPSVGLTLYDVVSYERGRRAPTREHLALLERALGLHHCELYDAFGYPDEYTNRMLQQSEDEDTDTFRILKKCSGKDHSLRIIMEDVEE